MNRNHISAQPPGRPTAVQHKPEPAASTRLEPPAAKAEPPSAAPTRFKSARQDGSWNGATRLQPSLRKTSKSRVKKRRQTSLSHRAVCFTRGIPWDEGTSCWCKLKAMFSALQTLLRVLSSAAPVKSAALTPPEAGLPPLPG